VVSENFEFRSTRNGTRVLTRNLADFQSVKSHFESQNLSYYFFFPKSEKPIKALIRHLPFNTPAEEISDGLVGLDFDVVSVKQMTATRRSPPEESKIINLPLFLVTLPRTAKSQDIFRLCYAAIVACGGAFPKLQFGISPPENSASNRGCLDKGPYGRRGFAGWLQYFTFGNVSLRDLGHWRDLDRGIKTLHLYTYYYVLPVHYIHTE
jgi:hypothetical protein